MIARGNQALRRLAHKSVLWLKIAVLVFAGFAPVIYPETAYAAQITPRKVSISTSQSAASSVQYDYTFSWPTSTEVDGVIFQFCTTPLGACTKPNAMDVSNDLVTLDAHTNFPENGTAFTEVASNTGDCSDTGSASTVTMYCISRNSTTSATGTNATVDLGAVLNPTIASGAYLTVYVRIGLYSANTFASGVKVHEGVVAAAITQQLTAVGRVAERLKFCVGAIDDATALPADCDTSFPTTTTIDLGIIDNLSVTAAPVDPSIANANTSNDMYGILMLNTNASGGTTVNYYPEAASSVTGGDTDQLRRFRVIPTDCSATPSSTTDQCFISADYTLAAGETITAGTERFGMAVACFNTTQGTTDNFDPTNGATWDSSYDGDGDDEDTGGNDCENESTAAYSWAFRDDGTPDTLVSTATSTEKVVDDEIIKIRFGASANATTPTGTYTVIITYIATPTF